MKTFTTILLVLLVSNIFGQATKQQIIEASYNYNTLQQLVKDHPELEKDTVFQKKYQRHSFWWQHRAAADGSYDRYYSQVAQFSNQSNKNGKTGQIWESVGPVYMGNNESNIGRVNAIWIDPDDETHIKIGSASAGMWETTNGDPATPTNWTCVTPHLPGGVGKN